MAPTDPFLTWMRATFEFQRTALRQSQRTVENGLALSLAVNRAFLDSSDSVTDAQRRTIDVFRTFAKRSLAGMGAGAVPMAVPPGTTGSPGLGAPADTAGFEPLDADAAVDEAFNVLTTEHAAAAQTARQVMEANLETYERVVEEYRQLLAEGTDAAIEFTDDLERATVETAGATVGTDERPGRRGGDRRDGPRR